MVVRWCVCTSVCLCVYVPALPKCKLILQGIIYAFLVLNLWVLQNEASFSSYDLPRRLTPATGVTFAHRIQIARNRQLVIIDIAQAP